MAVYGRDALAYILSRMGCVHPFVASRVLALAELRWLEERGERLTNLTYVSGPGVFYIEEIKDVIESDSCFAKREGDPSTGRRGCIEYRCAPPSLPEDARSVLDEAIEKAKGVDEMDLNSMVIGHPLFAKLARPMQ